KRWTRSVACSKPPAGSEAMCKRHALTFLGSMLACCIAGVRGQTLPAPPISPTPVINYEYDAEGNLIRRVEAPGVANMNFATVDTYDRLSRLKDSTNARAGKTQLGYDGMDRL